MIPKKVIADAKATFDKLQSALIAIGGDGSLSTALHSTKKVFQSSAFRRRSITISKRPR